MKYAKEHRILCLSNTVRSVLLLSSNLAQEKLKQTENTCFLPSCRVCFLRGTCPERGCNGSDCRSDTAPCIPESLTHMVEARMGSEGPRALCWHLRFSLLQPGLRSSKNHVTAVRWQQINVHCRGNSTWFLLSELSPPRTASAVLLGPATSVLGAQTLALS